MDERRRLRAPFAKFSLEDISNSILVLAITFTRVHTAPAATLIGFTVAILIALLILVGALRLARLSLAA